MKEVQELLESMLEVAVTIAPLLPPGGEKAIDAAAKVVAMIDRATDAFAKSETDEVTNQALEALVAQRDQIERDVNAHVDRTTAALRGTKA